MNMNKNKAKRRRGAGPAPSGAVARLKADVLAAKTREEKLSIGMRQYMDAAEAAVVELESVTAEIRRDNIILRATADAMAEAMRAKFVRFSPTTPAEMDGIESLLVPGCTEVQVFQIAGSAFLLLLAGVPAEPDRMEAMGRMIRDFGARNGVGILPMAAPHGKSVAEAFGLYRLDTVLLRQPPEPPEPAPTDAAADATAADATAADATAADATAADATAADATAADATAADAADATAADATATDATATDATAAERDERQELQMISVRTEDDLRAGATGAEERFPHISGLVFTPGVQYLAVQCGAYWLLDLVGSYQREHNVRDIHLQRWTLNVNHGKEPEGVVTLQGDGDVKVLAQSIPYTDFPLPKVRIWVQNGVMYLPCEH